MTQRTAKHPLNKVPADLHIRRHPARDCMVMSGGGYEVDLYPDRMGSVRIAGARLEDFVPMVADMFMAAIDPKVPAQPFYKVTRRPVPAFRKRILTTVRASRRRYARLRAA